MTHKSNNQDSTLTPSASGLIEFMDISPIACRIGFRSQIVMTTRAWSFGYAPDPGQHSLPQQIAMRTTAPQLRDMIEAMFSALVGEDRTPCQFTFATDSELMSARPASSLAVAVNRGREIEGAKSMTISSLIPRSSGSPIFFSSKVFLEVDANSTHRPR